MRGVNDEPIQTKNKNESRILALVLWMSWENKTLSRWERCKNWQKSAANKNSSCHCLGAALHVSWVDKSLVSHTIHLPSHPLWGG